jgi:hypothetical protein
VTGTPEWVRSQQLARAVDRLSSAAAWLAVVDDPEADLSTGVLGLFWDADGAMAACLDNHRAYLTDGSADLAFEQVPNANQHTATYNPGPCATPVTYEVTQLPIQ